MADPTDEHLRESARHRGLKLLKSRRRKPGGDFGRYGLTDASGQPVLGIGDDGLTATPAEIADYLRKGDAATWASSVEATPARPERPPARKEEEQKEDVLPRRRKPTANQRSTRDPEPPPPRENSTPAKPKPKHKPEPKPLPPKPELTIRPATRADAEVLAELLPDTSAATLAERLATAAALNEPVLVADQGGVIGCLAWHVLPTLQHGPIARITFLAIVPAERRRGIATRLLDELIEQVTARDLPLIEAISDIAIQSAHGFFRRRTFDQTSYRFIRKLAR